ncbi:MAG: YaiI/YqxD family protein [Oscillospiraceae bacterium]
MQILIDADGCPVIDIAIKLAQEYKLSCVLLCDTSHEFSKQGATTITVEKGADSVDFALVNKVQAGDIVITQDYGLACMCLAKKAVPISQDGLIYDNNNIDALLLQRHCAKKIRMAGGRLHGSSKRTALQDKKFQEEFIKLISSLPAK